MMKKIICEECGKSCKSIKGLVSHFSKIHKISSKDYFNKWIKDEKDGICKRCGNNTNYINLSMGYSKYCSAKCIIVSKETLEKTKKTNLEKYGVCYPIQNKLIFDKALKTNLEKYGSLHPGQNREILNKIKHTNLIMYGVENSFQRKDVKEKCKEQHLKNYGVENISTSETIKKRKIQTSLKNYGVENPNQSDIIKKQKVQTCLQKYGVEYTHQNREILNKSLKTRRLLKIFKDTNLTYQGSYELDFLEKFYDKIDIENGPSIPYVFNGKNKVYHSDFYIPSKNLIVEIKSSYILTIDKEIEEKKEACLNQGYDYVLLLDKNYNELKI